MAEIFPREWIEAQAGQWANRNAWDRTAQQLLVEDPDRQSFRRWLQEQADELSPSEASQVVARLRDENNYLQALHELCAAAVLRRSGLTVAYERPIAEGLTPDWLCFDNAGDLVLVAEVVTRTNIHHDKRRRWVQLKSRASELPLDRAVSTRLSPATRAASEVLAPDDGEQKAIIKALGEWLRTPPTPGEDLDFGPYIFRYMGPSHSGCLFLTTPSPEAGTVDHRPLVKSIRKKISRYGRACDQRGVPLMVVIASDLLNGHSVDGLKSELGFAPPSFTAIFDGDEDGVFLDETVSMADGTVENPFDDRLSAIGYLEAPLGRVEFELVANPRAKQILRPGMIWTGTFPTDPTAR